MLGAWPSPPATVGLFAGGLDGSNAAVNNIDQFNIVILSNATDFGDLLATKEEIQGCSSATRGVFSAGLGWQHK